MMDDNEICNRAICVKVYLISKISRLIILNLVNLVL